MAHEPDWMKGPGFGILVGSLVVCLIVIVFACNRCVKKREQEQRQRQQEQRRRRHQQNYHEMRELRLDRELRENQQEQEQEQIRQRQRAAASASTAPYDRTSLVRDCLEFRTISTPPPRSATHKSYDLEQGSSDNHNGNDDGNAKTTETKRTSRVTETDEGGFEIGDVVVEDVSPSNDDGNVKRKTKKKKRRKKKSEEKSNTEDDSESGEDGDCDGDGNNGSAVRKKRAEKEQKRRKRKRKKKQNEDNNNANTNSSPRTSLVLDILRNNSVTDSVRAMVADVLRHESSRRDEDSARIYPTQQHVSIDLVLESIRMSGNKVRHKDSCSICLEPFRVGDKVARMKQYDDDRPCSKHWFKEDCIVEWLETNNDCPLSRIRIVPAASNVAAAAEPAVHRQQQQQQQQELQQRQEPQAPMETAEAMANASAPTVAAPSFNYAEWLEQNGPAVRLREQQQARRLQEILFQAQAEEAERRRQLELELERERQRRQELY